VRLLSWALCMMTGAGPCEMLEYGHHLGALAASGQASSQAGCAV
jgi:hypothetical protein